MMLFSKGYSILLYITRGPCEGLHSRERKRNFWNVYSSGNFTVLPYTSTALRCTTTVLPCTSMYFSYPPLYFHSTFTVPSCTYPVLPVLLLSSPVLPCTSLYFHCALLYFSYPPPYYPVLLLSSPVLLCTLLYFSYPPLYFHCTLLYFGGTGISPFLPGWTIIFYKKIDLIYIRKKFLNVKYNIDCC